MQGKMSGTVTGAPVILLANLVMCVKKNYVEPILHFRHAQITPVPCHLDGRHLAVNTKLLVNIF